MSFLVPSNPWESQKVISRNHGTKENRSWKMRIYVRKLEKEPSVLFIAFI